MTACGVSYVSHPTAVVQVLGFLPQTNKSTFVHLWVAICLAGCVAHDNANGRIDNFLDINL